MKIKLELELQDVMSLSTFIRAYLEKQPSETFDTIAEALERGINFQVKKADDISEAFDLIQFYDLLEKEIYVEVRPVDWSNWMFKIVCKDIMAPMCIVYQDKIEYSSHRSCLRAGIKFAMNNFIS